MLFNEQGLLNLDEVVMNHPSWKKMMEDGIITDEELATQAENVANILKEIEATFNDNQKKTIENLLAETSVLFAAYHYNAIQKIGNK